MVARKATLLSELSFASERLSAYDTRAANRRVSGPIGPVRPAFFRSIIEPRTERTGTDKICSLRHNYFWPQNTYLIDLKQSAARISRS